MLMLEFAADRGPDRRGGPISKRARSTASRPPGSLSSLNAKQLVLRNRRGTVDVPLAKLAGARARAGRRSRRQAPACWVELVDGSRLPAAEYAVTSGTAPRSAPAGRDARSSHPRRFAGFASRPPSRSEAGQAMGRDHRDQGGRRFAGRAQERRARLPGRRVCATSTTTTCQFELDERSRFRSSGRRSRARLLPSATGANCPSRSAS